MSSRLADPVIDRTGEDAFDGAVSPHVLDAGVNVPPSPWRGETGPADHRYRRLLGAPPDGILVVGEDGGTRLANAAA